APKRAHAGLSGPYMVWDGVSSCEVTVASFDPTCGKEPVDSAGTVEGRAEAGGEEPYEPRSEFRREWGRLFGGWEPSLRDDALNKAFSAIESRIAAMFEGMIESTNFVNAVEKVLEKV